jgi:predicted RNA-binding protein with PUA-like domain
MASPHCEFNVLARRNLNAKIRKTHALLADEIGTRRMQHRRSRARAEKIHRVVRRAQLPRAQLHARSDAARDRVLFYHSSCEVPGIAGIAEVSKLAYPDETQFDKKSKYFDPKATRENPRWVHVDVKLVKKTRLVPLSELRTYPQLAKMQLLQRGNRLSITPVDPAEWKFIEKIL